MSFNVYVILAIIAASIATFLTRVLPFLIFDKRQKKNNFLEFLHNNMPLMIMIVLVFYAIKDTEFVKYPYGIPELIGILITFLLHIAFKNPLLTIITATAVYMLLSQVVFA